MPNLSAHLADDRIPSGREGPCSSERIVYSRSANTYASSESCLAEGLGDVMSGFHAGQYPQMVDKHKTTIGCLRRNARFGHLRGMSEEPKAPYLDIGQRLKMLRDGFSDDTQRAWANRHGFSPTQYNNWENGTRRIPIECAVRLCEVYGVTLDFVYRGRRDGLSENAAKAV